MVVYGHTPVPAAEWINRTLCVDTGCVFGGALTALRYPERELVVGAGRTGLRRTGAPVAPGQRRSPDAYDLLDLEDVLRQAHHRHRPDALHHRAGGKCGGGHRSHEPVLRRSPLADLPAADHVPAGNQRTDGLLEHPDEAFAYYRRAGVGRVVVKKSTWAPARSS